MQTKIWWFLSLIFTVLALVPAGAHLAELPRKLGLPGQEYLIVQQIYTGWALFGVAIIAALVSTGVLTILMWGRGWTFALTLLAFLSMATTQVIFWTATQPANRLTRNWSLLPENWAQLRLQWEVSHATNAILTLIAMLALFIAVLRR